MGSAGVQASQTQSVFEQQGKPENVLYHFLALAVPARIEALQRQEGGVSAEDFTRFPARKPPPSDVRRKGRFLLA